MADYTIFYITPDPARAVGIEKILTNFHIVCYDDKPIVDLLQKRKIPVFSLKRRLGDPSDQLRNAGKILEHPLTQEYIKENSNGTVPAIMYFKPSFKIDILCNKNKYIKIGNDAEMNRLFEDKIKFFNLCRKNNWPVPRGKVRKIKSFVFKEIISEFNLPFVVQFGRGWAGSTTFFINSEKEWDDLYEKWGDIEAKVTVKIEGHTYLNNACITSKAILISSPSLQLPPLPGINGNPAATYGRQWPSGLNADQVKKIDAITVKVGEKMRESGYKGWFGLDFLVEEGSGKVYLSEDNARLTASTNFYTQMEYLSGNKETMLNHHIDEFLYQPHKNDWKRPEFEASQIVLRNFEKTKIKVLKTLRSGIYRNSDLEFIREGLGIEDLKDKGEIYLSFPGKGEVINSEIETAAAEIFIRALGNDKYYSAWVNKFMQIYQNKFVYKNI